MIPTQTPLSMKRKVKVFPEREVRILTTYEHRNGAWPQKNSVCCGDWGIASTSGESKS